MQSETLTVESIDEMIVKQMAVLQSLFDLRKSLQAVPQKTAAPAAAKPASVPTNGAAEQSAGGGPKNSPRRRTIYSQGAEGRRQQVAEILNGSGPLPLAQVARQCGYQAGPKGEKFLLRALAPMIDDGTIIFDEMTFILSMPPWKPQAG